MKKNKINLNYAGLFAFSMLLIIGFISPIYYYTFLSKDALTSTATWFDIVLDIFSSKNLTYVDFNNIFYLMFFCFFITLILYFLSGFFIIEERWAKYASIMTFVYFILGMLYVALFNRNNTPKLFGFELSHLYIGVGIWVVPIVGIIYLIFYKKINELLV